MLKFLILLCFSLLFCACASEPKVIAMPPKEGAVRAEQSLSKEDVRQAAESKKILAALGAMGSGDGGELQDVFGGGDSTHLDKAFGGVGGIKAGSSVSPKPGRATMISTKVLNTSKVSSAQVRRELRRVKRQVQYCYRRQLLQDDQLAGELSVRGVVNAQGKIESTQVLGNSVHPVVGVCVQNVLKRFRFRMSTATGLTPALVIEQSWKFTP